LSPLERLIVTRPAAEAASWVQALQAQGWPAQALPLIDISEPQDAATLALLRHWRTHWLDMDAMLFVSGAAVRHFFAQDVRAPTRPDGDTRFWAPGPGTAQVLAQALTGLGLDPTRIDAPPADAGQFDSEALWPVVASQVRSGQRILVVRGASPEGAAAAGSSPPPNRHAGNGRDWLIQQCEAAGARVESCVAYERAAPRWTTAQSAVARAAASSGSAWLFSSSEAVNHLLTAAPHTDWSPACAIATHPRIAASARAAGFGRVIETRPALPDVLRALESNWSPA
jgi:uroporphyrinogen-III synthase